MSERTAPTKHYYQVLVPPLAQALTYSCAENQGPIQPSVGFRVVVPLGRRKASGFVIEVLNQRAASSAKFEIKPILDPRAAFPCFNTEQLEFFNWVSEYYAEPLAQVLDVAIPASVAPIQEKFVQLIGASPAGALRSVKQQKVLEFLRENTEQPPLSKLKQRFGAVTQALRKLEQLGLVKIISRNTANGMVWEHPAPAWAKTDVQLTPAQQDALEQIQSALSPLRFNPCLMHGVTGSGKTEVYIEAIAHAAALGLGALVIVPEIALTPQLVDRFRARLGDNISVLHSALSKRQRWEAWQALIEGRNCIAIGTRSAVFAPIKSLGLVIVDEEHDQSLKQSEGLRYNARDLAVMRAKFQNCPVVLGSATPSLESFANAQNGKFKLLRLPSRPGLSAAPTQEIVDMNRLKPWELPSRNISPALHQAIEQTLARGEQVFIMYNRRGFASYLQCPTCEQVMICPNCSVSLTYHQAEHALVCHYCTLSMPAPHYCPACSARQADPEKAKLQHRGAGTERVFEELQVLFPEVSIARLDRDSASDHRRYKDILDSVRNAQTQILVGTQMIAKGHDLPLVTLVGVADCDVGLHLPDFRAAERSFQLLTQVAGRAGRADRPGRVILQTRVPRHPALVHTAMHDYEQFAQDELRSRKILGYPPFSKLLRIVASTLKEPDALQALLKVRRLLDQIAKSGGLKLQVLGPAPAPLARIKARYRAHLLVKSTSAAQLNGVVKRLKGAMKKDAAVRLAFDLDPQDML